MDGLSLVSKRRDQILEDFCVFASVSDENVLKLISLNVMRHAAKSLTSSQNPATIMKALNLCGYLMNQDFNKKVATVLIQTNAIQEIVNFMDNPNESVSLEALYIIDQISKHSEPLAFRELTANYQILRKAAKLLEESILEITSKEAAFKK